MTLIQRNFLGQHEDEDVDENVDSDQDNQGYIINYNILYISY